MIATANKQDSGTFPMNPPSLDRFGVSVIVTGLDPMNFYKLIDLAHAPRDFQQKRDVTVDELMNDVQLATKELTLRQIQREISLLPVDPEAIMRTEFFLAQLRYCARLHEGASDPFSKDKANLQFAEHKASDLCIRHKGDGGCPNTDARRICNQTENLNSARTMQTLVRTAQFFAWWLDLYARREGIDTGETKVDSGIVAAALPFILQHRLEPTPFARQQFGLAAEEKFNGDVRGWVNWLWGNSGATFDEPQVREALRKYRRAVISLSQPGDDSLRHLRPTDAEVIPAARLDAEITDTLLEVGKINDVARYGLLAHLLDLAGRKRG